MTKEEFVRRRASLSRETPPFDGWFAVGATVFTVLGLPLAFSAYASLLWIHLAVLLAGCLLYLAYSVRWRKRTGLLCDACRRPLLRRDGDGALRFGTCPYCHRPAFAPGPG